jgi:hypothetical protein
VHTLARPITTLLPDLFKHADCDAVANIMAKVALDNCLRNGFVPARKYLHKTLVDIVRAYRLASSGAALGMAPSKAAPGRRGRRDTGKPW